MRGPLISVIITAHNREKYLKTAIQSVIDQTLSPDEYEIIIVKNFDLPEIDAMTRERKIIDIFYDGPIGKAYSIALKYSSGSIIAFLDDDDIFAPSKLSVIANVFLNDQVGYYHNSAIMIDDNGSLIGGRIKENKSKSMNFNLKENNHIINLIIKKTLFSNLSSTCVRKSVIERYLDVIENMTSGTDLIVFIASLDTYYISLFGEEKLTYYRIHNSASNRTDNQISYMDTLLTDSISTMFSLSSFNNSSCARPKIKSIVAAKIIYLTIQNAIINQDKEERFIKIKEIIVSWLDGARIYSFKFMILVFLFLLTPTYTRILLMRFNSLSSVISS